MRVIGIDPGYDRLGVAVMEKIDGQETLIFSTCLQSDRKLVVADRIDDLGHRLTEIFSSYQPDQLAIEKLFFNQNRTTALSVAEMRGVVIYLAKCHNCKVAEFGPQEIKVAVTGYGKSDKRAVAEMLSRLIKNLPISALDDEYDAIAIALTGLVSTPIST
ncbi:hypothetical protein A2837_03085 [Candidatus Kaiserbacteria bacterium RIFCSPHIGHO2_01_FULL_46_22]|uniref:Crossover junction endodeoxyribonuclease RuvC n=1 Tax=Candidatus Kaiserbacteria bacterium RIFCSPHIGHO2_01_FULL_46_22 TaxID=1798475 RepID=A0A1F6BXA8_9BACT|nr:MAG: hypothetical protein A2837_03085 [Candidatus Kaiserbacteria bacterium RIFCSPHIGHO2_01_FULL_46_22]